MYHRFSLSPVALLHSGASSPVELELPNQWVWDIIDEFIYQFQEFSNYSTKIKTRTEEEIASIKALPHVWNVHGVLKYLHAFATKSDVVHVLESEKESVHYGSPLTCQI
jgi:translation initiation factor 3 subunit L